MDPHLACSINQSLFSITLARHLPKNTEKMDGILPSSYIHDVEKDGKESKSMWNTLNIHNDVKDGKESNLKWNIRHVC